MCSGDSHKVWISSHDEESSLHCKNTDWSWVHSSNFSSITLAVLGIGRRPSTAQQIDGCHLSPLK